jgi:hypothetical protein
LKWRIEMQKKLGASLLSVSLIATSAVHANLPVLANSFILSNETVETDLGEFEMVVDAVVKDRSDMIKDAALAASASYSNTRLVALKSAPVRGKTQEERDVNDERGVACREAMFERGEQIVTFSATIKENILGSLVATGSMPAGIISLRGADENRAPRITVSFHGTESKRDALTDINAVRQHSVLLESAEGWRSYLPFTSATVHGGFNNRYMESREAMFDVLNELLAQNKLSFADVEVVVVGHSLGGALATLAAIDIVQTTRKLGKNTKVYLVTFSSPAVANAQGAEKIETILGKERILRVWRELDPVTISLFGFTHVGTSIMLKATSQGMMPSMENHKMLTILEDAESALDVDFVLQEEKPVSQGEGFFGSAKNFFGGLNLFSK